MPLSTQKVFIYSLFVSVKIMTGFLQNHSALLPIKKLNPFFQTIMHNSIINFKFYNGKKTLSSQRVFIYSLCVNLQRTIGFPYDKCALIPIKTLNPLSQAKMCNSTNNVNLYNGKQPLSTQRVFSYSLYENLQTLIGFPYDNFALIPM